MKAHTSRPAKGSYACLTMERSYGGSIKHPTQAMSFTPNFALLSAPLRRAPAVLAGSSACELTLENLCVSGHNPLSQREQLRPPPVVPGDLTPGALTMTQAPQSGGGRTTTYVNKHTDQLGRLADKATDQARNVAQHVEEFANNAAQLGREAGERLQEVASSPDGFCPVRRALHPSSICEVVGQVPSVYAHIKFCGWNLSFCDQNYSTGVFRRTASGLSWAVARVDIDVRSTQAGGGLDTSIVHAPFGRPKSCRFCRAGRRND